MGEDVNPSVAVGIVGRIGLAWLAPRLSLWGTTPFA